MRYVIAVDVEPLYGGTFELEGVAAKFRPHITVRGRFEAALGVSEAVLASYLSTRLADVVLPAIALSGPFKIGADVVWYECLSGERGFDPLVDLHASLSGRLDFMVGHDLTPAAQSGPRFRPHMTVAWGEGAAIDRAAPQRLSARPIAFALYAYERAPPLSPVRRIELCSPWTRSA